MLFTSVYLHTHAGMSSPSLPDCSAHLYPTDSVALWFTRPAAIFVCTTMASVSPQHTKTCTCINVWPSPSLTEHGRLVPSWLDLEHAYVEALQTRPGKTLICPKHIDLVPTPGFANEVFIISRNAPKPVESC